MFTINTKKVSQNVRRMKRDVLGTSSLVRFMKKLHVEVIEVNVKARLSRNVVLSHKSAETWPPTGKITNEIKSNITSKAKRIKSRTSIFAGTVEMRAMDRDDPIKTLFPRRDFTKKSGFPIRMWRILEWGTVAHPISPRRAKFLAWISPTSKTWQKAPFVQHPGTTGRSYLLDPATGAPYARDRIIVQKIRRRLGSMTKKYSYK